MLIAPLSQSARVTFIAAFETQAKADFEEATRLYEAAITNIRANAQAAGLTPPDLAVYYSRLGEANFGVDPMDASAYSGPAQA